MNFDHAPCLDTILILTQPRTGSTWLARILSLDRFTAYRHEPDNELLWPHIARAKQPLGRFPMLDSNDQAPEWLKMWLRWQTTTVPQYVMKPLAIVRWADTKVGSSVFPRLSGLSELHPKFSKTSRVVVKSVHAGGSAAWILSHARAGGTKAVILRRSPYAVAASLLRHDMADSSRFTYSPSCALAEKHSLPHPASPRRLDLTAWQAFFLDALLRRAANVPSTMIVKYEALVQDGLRMRLLAEALGLPWTAQHESFKMGLVGKTDGARHSLQRSYTQISRNWRSTLSREAVQALEYAGDWYESDYRD